MRRRIGSLMATAAASALLAAGCASDGGSDNAGNNAASSAPAAGSTAAGSTRAGSAGGSTAGSGSLAGKKITVWTLEDVQTRIEATKKLVEGFKAKTGADVELVAVAEDQFDQLVTSAGAAGNLPDVVGALSLAGVRSMDDNEFLDTEVPGQVVSDLGQDTFASRALDLTKKDDAQLSVPSDGWAQLLFYRKDLFDKAGLARPDTYEAISAAATKLKSGGTAGVVAATTPGDAFTQQSFEYFALGNNCQLVNDQGDVTLDSPECTESFRFYSDLIRNGSLKGNQDVDSTRATYFAGKAGMVVWSSFLLDELAGLRKDALPTCPECRSDKGFLAKNTGVVAAVQGPKGQPAQYGEIVSWVVTKDAEKDASKQFIEYMMSDAYRDWLALAPEGKVPVRKGTKEDPQAYVKAWGDLKAGVDTMAPLSKFYGPDVIDAVRNSPDTFSRWGLSQGQGELVGATLGQLPVPKALSKLITSGGDPAQAAKEAAAAVEELKP